MSVRIISHITYIPDDFPAERASGSSRSFGVACPHGQRDCRILLYHNVLRPRASTVYAKQGLERVHHVSPTPVANERRVRGHALQSGIRLRRRERGAAQAAHQHHERHEHRPARAVRKGRARGAQHALEAGYGPRPRLLSGNAPDLSLLPAPAPAHKPRRRLSRTRSSLRRPSSCC